jgi:16S rRNA (guanine966-N2)-methyltransferase
LEIRGNLIGLPLVVLNVDPLMPKSPNGSRNSVRIISGEHRSRKIQFPDVPGLRPTADRIRETLFNWLREDVAGARCLDLFAGSGALGLEALSRGASAVSFIDASSAAIAAIRTALTTLRIDGSSVYHADAQAWIKAQPNTVAPYDIVFLDPPFAANLLPSVCHLLVDSSLLSPGSKIYLESATDLSDADLPKSWVKLKSGKAGAVFFYLLSPVPKE